MDQVDDQMMCTRPSCPGHSGVVHLLLLLLLFTASVARAQTDILPSSVDMRMVQGASTDQLLLQVQIHSTAGFGGVLSAITVTIRYDSASGASLGPNSSFCTAWSPFPASPEVDNAGIAYRTYSGFGFNRLEDPTSSGGCGVTLVPEQWFTVATIPVIGSCTAFTLGNDAWTASHNRNYYMSMNGQDVTGVIVGGPVDAGDCAVDCNGVPGGPALPGTACDDNDPNTANDTWSAACACIGIPICTPPAITGTTSNSPVCSTGALSLGVNAGGTGPLTYSWSGAGTFAPNAGSQFVSVTGAATGSYHVEVANGCGTVGSDIFVVVTAPPSATISYGGSPYCSSGGTANVTHTGSTGGSYTASPAGLALNVTTGAITLGSSTPGGYTVTYAIAASGGCAALGTTSPVTVTAAPSATISYSGSPYCSSSGTATVTHGGSAGGAYSATSAGLDLNASTGAIAVGTSSPGTYTVTYTVAASGGCAAFSTVTSVVIDEATAWYADQDGDGFGDPTDSMMACVQPAGYVAISGDLCPMDPNKLTPGVCGCGVPDTDTDGDGVADCIDSCPNLPGGVGDACDDGDPNTLNDVIIADCTCAGTLYDCPGIMANIGDSCDDGNANTLNDIITSECICQGTFSTSMVEPEGATGVELELFPNPSRSGVVNLRIKGAPLAMPHVVIVVLDAAGHQVHTETAQMSGGTLFLSMDLARKLSRGAYMVVAEVGGHRYMQQLVVQ